MFYVAGCETVQRDIARATNKLVDLRDVKVLRARRQTFYGHTFNHILTKWRNTVMKGT